MSNTHPISANNERREEGWKREEGEKGEGENHSCHFPEHSQRIASSVNSTYEISNPYHHPRLCFLDS